MAYSVVVGEFLLEWCGEYFGQPQVWYITDVLQLHNCDTSVM